MRIIREGSRLKGSETAPERGAASGSGVGTAAASNKKKEGCPSFFLLLVRTLIIRSALRTTLRATLERTLRTALLSPGSLRHILGS